MITLLVLLIILSWIAMANAGCTQTYPTQSCTFTLSWSDTSKNEAGFYIERRVTRNGKFTRLVQVVANTNKWKDTIKSAPSKMEYCYRIIAYNAAGISPPSPTACIITAVIKEPVPEPPVNLTVHQAEIKEPAPAPPTNLTVHQL
jgi:hypothetical protein